MRTEKEISEDMTKLIKLSKQRKITNVKFIDKQLILFDEALKLNLSTKKKLNINMQKMALIKVRGIIKKAGG